MSKKNDNCISDDDKVFMVNRKKDGQEIYNQLDMFLGGFVDASPKSDDTSMEVPIFSLSKNINRKRFDWNDGKGRKISVIPNEFGRATIWDKEILIFIFSQIVGAINKNIIPSRTIRVSSHEILQYLGRNTGGNGYKELEDGLRRLQGTTIETNIKTEGLSRRGGFSLIQDWFAVEKDNSGRMVSLEITISEWFYQSVKNLDVLTYDRAYFRLTKGLEKRLYEIFHKHLGKQKQFTIHIEKLFLKSGSGGTLRKFRFFLNKHETKTILGISFRYNEKTKKVTIFR